MRDKIMQQQRGGILKFLIVSICLCTFPLRGLAQNNLTEDDVQTTDFKPGNFGFNAVDITQGRFQYSDSIEYRNKGFFDHLSLGVLGRYDRILNRGMMDFRPALNYGIYLSKELSKNHGLRLQLHTGSYYTPNPAVRLNKYQAEMLYSFNWTRYFGGYNPYRNIEAVTNIGLGGYLSNCLNESEIGALLLFGAGLRFKLTPLFSLNVDPFVALTDDGIDHSGDQNFHGYDILYGTDVSLAYTFDNELSLAQLRQLETKNYLDFGIGSQFGLNAKIPFWQSADPKLRLGFTRRFQGGMGLRLAGNISANSWNRSLYDADNMLPAYELHHKSALLGGSLDVMLNPHTLITGRDDQRYEWNLLAGWEYGKMIKTGYIPGKTVNTTYDGFSAGMLFRYIYDENTAFYLEPRFTFANYDVPFEGYVNHHNESYFSVLAGMQYGSNEYRFLGRKSQPAPFMPNLSLSLTGGQNFLFLADEMMDKNRLDFMAGIAGEILFTPYSGLRLSADYSRLNHKGLYNYSSIASSSNGGEMYNGLASVNYNYLNLSADYLFSISTLLQGYTYDRKWDFSLAMGPVYSLRLSEQGNLVDAGESNDAIAVDYSGVATSSLGLQIGLPVGYRLTPHWNVFFEPRARFYAAEFNKNAHVGGLTRILNSQVGMKYTLNDRYRTVKHGSEDFTPTFSLLMLAGGDKLISPLLSGESSNFDLSVGLGGEYRFSPLSGARLTFFHNEQSGRAIRYNGNGIGDYSATYLDIAAEYLFDFTSLLNGYTSDRKWTVNLGAGPVYTVRLAMDNSEGMSMASLGKHAWGAQLGFPITYSIDEQWGLSLAPYARLFSADYWGEKSMKNSLSVFMNTQLGVKYTLDGEPAIDKVDADDAVDFVAFSLGAQYAANSSLAFGNTGGSHLGIGFGKWFNSTLGIRFAGYFGENSYTSVKYANDYDVLLKSVRLGGHIDFLFNPFALQSGYEPSRFSANLLAGVEAGFSMDKNWHTHVDNRTYNALGAGMQFRYNTDENHSLYVEPRYTFGEDLFSLTAGMEYAMNERRFRSKIHHLGEFSPTFSLSFLGGLDYLVNPATFAGSTNFDMSTGIAGEYRFSPYSGVRMLLNHNTMSGTKYQKGALADYSATYLNVAAEYLFDLSTLLQGYTSDRKWSIGLGAGPVFTTRLARDDSKGMSSTVTGRRAFGGQVSIPVTYAFNEQWGLSLEPRGRMFAASFSSRDLSDYPTVLLNTQMGVKYTFNDRTLQVLPEDAEDKEGYDFVSFNIGSQYETGTGLSLGSTSGIQFGAGIGRWVNSLLGFRLTGYFGDNNYTSIKYADAYDVLLKSVRLGGHADILFNPFALQGGYETSRFSANLLAGIEAGWAIDKNWHTHVDNRTYNAIGAGMQLRYNTDENHSLYVEPRYTFGENIFSLTAGMEYAMNERKFRSKIHYIGEFKPAFSLSFLGGLDYLVNPATFAGSANLDMSTGIAGEYRFSPYSGVRMLLNHNTMSGTKYQRGALADYSATYLNVAAEYLFDLSTLLQGYTSDRKWSIGLGAGPVFTTRLAQDHSKDMVFDVTGKRAFGGQVSVPVTYAFNEQWGVSLEPRARMFAASFSSRDLSDYPTVLVNTQMGVRYTFGDKALLFDDEEDKSYDFVNFNMGVRYAGGTNMSFASTSDFQLGVGVGRWMSPSVGVRLVGEVAANNHHALQYNTDAVTYERLLKSARISGRFDFLINPIAMLGMNEYTQWSANLVAGWEAGLKMNKVRPESYVDNQTYNAFATGIQLRYNTDEHHALYVEPRYTFGEQLFSVTAGMEFAMNEHRFQSKAHYLGEFKPYKAISFQGGVNHQLRTVTYAGASELDFNFGVSGEYHFSPYSGARASVDYAHITNTTMHNQDLIDYDFGNVNVSVDYLFDLSTLLAGYTKERQIDVALAMGPVLSSRLSEGYELMNKLSSTSLGAQFSVPVQWHINNNWGISLEPRARMFSKNYANLSYKANVGKTTKLIDVQLGLKYTF